MREYDGRREVFINQIHILWQKRAKLRYVPIVHLQCCVFRELPIVFLANLLGTEGVPKNENTSLEEGPVPEQPLRDPLTVLDAFPEIPSREHSILELLPCSDPILIILGPSIYKALDEALS